MKQFNQLFLLLVSLCGLLLVSCEEDGYGANPYDPNTPITVSELPKVLSFTPEEGKAGTVVTITGKNFMTASDVSFGGKSADSFEIVDSTTITAVVSPYGGTGAVAVTNHKGTRGKEGFFFIKDDVDPEQGGNLALRGVATASEPITGVANNVNDGDVSTLWQAKGKENLFVEIDLRKTYSINTIITTWDPAAAATDYILMVSTDGIIYETITEEHGWDAMKDGGVKEIKFENVDARYVKFEQMTNTATPWNITLKEFEIYNEQEGDAENDKPVDTPMDKNLAQGKVATASSNAIATSNAVIGNPEHVWQAEGNVDEWFQVDLGALYSINNVTILWDAGAYAKDCEILVSKDNQTFESVTSLTNWDASKTAGLQSLPFGKEMDVRYVKAVLKNGATPWNMTIKEFEVYRKSQEENPQPQPEKPVETPFDENIAKGKTATASSNAGAVSNVVYGDPVYTWQAAGNADEWIQVDLGALYSINNVTLFWDAGAYAKDCEILVSSDNETFTSVKAITNWDASKTAGKQAINFGKEVAARYVKAVLKNGATPWNMTVKEFEVYRKSNPNQPEPVPTPENENLAKGKTATASSNEVAAGNAVFGDPVYIWQAAGNTNEWLQVDLGALYSINNVTIIWDAGAYAKDCEILVSQDGKTYTSVSSVKDWNSATSAGTQSIDFGKEVAAQYVKAVLKNGATPYNMTIKEFEVYRKTSK